VDEAEEADRELDDRFMGQALAQARRADVAGEVPVGAVVVDPEGRVIGSGFNQPLGRSDPTAHAEILAMRQAAERVGNYRLPHLTLYCTIEPCVMCAGAIVHARIARLVYGASDLKAGAAGSLYNIVADPRLNHRVKVCSGVRAEECRALMREFFEKRRM
jgi:tRNA(adenine34) deaminase